MAYKPVNKMKRRHVSLQILAMNEKHKKDSALLIWRHQTLVPQGEGGDRSTHSTGSLEGVTFLAVVIVDKS